MGVYYFKEPHLFDKQKAFVYSNKRYALSVSATKTGKTTMCIYWLIREAIKGGGEGKHYWWVAPIASQAEIAFNRMLRQIPREIVDKKISSKGSQAIHLVNGAIIDFKSGDNDNSLYGEDVWAVVFDEASRCNETVFDAIQSVTTATGGKIRIIANTLDETNWTLQLIKKFNGDEDWFMVEMNADDSLRWGIYPPSELEMKRKSMSEAKFLSLYYNVPIASNDKRWFYNFNSEKHVGQVKYNPEYEYALCVDFNVNPLCAIVVQKGINNNSFFYVIKEYRFENATLEDLVERVKVDFKARTKMMLIADATGYNRDVGYSKSEYSKIQKMKNLLGLSDYALRHIPKKNPSYANSRELCNTLLLHHPNLKIDPSCKHTITDLQIAKTDEKSLDMDKLFKDNDTHNMNLTDCFRYACNSLFKDYIKSLEK